MTPTGNLRKQKIICNMSKIAKYIGINLIKKVLTTLNCSLRNIDIRSI